MCTTSGGARFQMLGIHYQKKILMQYVNYNNDNEIVL
jgi:hypothetical protein